MVQEHTEMEEVVEEEVEVAMVMLQFLPLQQVHIQLLLEQVEQVGLVELVEQVELVDMDSQEF